MDRTGGATVCRCESTVQSTKDEKTGAVGTGFSVNS